MLEHLHYPGDLHEYMDVLTETDPDEFWDPDYDSYIIGHWVDTKCGGSAPLQRTSLYLEVVDCVGCGAPFA